MDFLINTVLNFGKMLSKMSSLFGMLLGGAGTILLKGLGYTTAGTTFGFKKLVEFLSYFFTGNPIFKFLANFRENVMRFMCRHPKEVVIVVVSGFVLYLYWQSNWNYKHLFP
jgi:hypothetical protein